MDQESNDTGLSYKLSCAISRGRKGNALPQDRETVLFRLLLKRAAAHRAGLDQLEQIMREQILWSLPMKDCAEQDKELAA